MQVEPLRTYAHSHGFEIAEKLPEHLWPACAAQLRRAAAFEAGGRPRAAVRLVDAMNSSNLICLTDKVQCYACKPWLVIFRRASSAAPLGFCMGRVWRRGEARRARSKRAPTPTTPPHITPHTQASFYMEQYAPSINLSLRTDAVPYLQLSAEWQAVLSHASARLAQLLQPLEEQQQQAGTDEESGTPAAGLVGGSAGSYVALHARIEDEWFGACRAWKKQCR